MELSEDFCHTIVPVFPVSLIDVVSPLQIEDLKAVAVPPTEDPSTLTDATVLLALEHFPLVTNALYHVFTVKLGVV